MGATDSWRTGPLETSRAYCHCLTTLMQVRPFSRGKVDGVEGAIPNCDPFESRKRASCARTKQAKKAQAHQNLVTELQAITQGWTKGWLTIFGKPLIN